METKTVSSKRNFSGDLRVPGDKSISHRVAMLSGIASGTSVIHGFLHSEDCLSTLYAMKALGAMVEREPGGVVRVTGTEGQLKAPLGPLDMGNAGTGMRLLSGLLAGYPLEVVLTGDASLRSRPMKRISKPLEMMGADVALTGDGGCAPIRIQGGALQGIEYALPMASAQVKSCVLLAGLNAEGRTTVLEPAPSRDHTERILSALGVGIHVDGLRITLNGYSPEGFVPEAREWCVPGDFSSASFLIVAAAGMDGAHVTVRSVGLNPRRDKLLDVLKRMGAAIETSHVRDIDGEPVGDVVVSGRPLKGTLVCGAEIPALIDELPLVAVAGAVAEGPTEIRDAGELRVKESDRIATMAGNLAKAGVPVAEYPDGMRIAGGGALQKEASFDSHGDHRVAMAMAILALYAGGPYHIMNTDCVKTSYPSFWDDLSECGAKIE